MAQSIYVTLDTLKVETSVPEVKDKDGKVIRKSFGSVAHTLPRENYPTTEIFDDEEKFLEWSQSNGSLLSLLQAGINDWLIDDRATFKRIPTKVSGKSWSIEYGQKQVDSRKWKVATRPNMAGTKKINDARFTDCMNMVLTLTGAGKTNTEIETLLNAVYDAEIVTGTMDAIAKMKADTE